MSYYDNAGRRLPEGLTPNEQQSNIYTRTSPLETALGFIERSAQGVKQVGKLIQKRNLEALKDIPEGASLISRMEAVMSNQPSLSEKSEAFMSGLSGEEKTTMNKLYENVGIEGVPLLGFISELVFDPLMYGGYSAITKGIGKVITKVAPHAVKAAKAAGKIIKPVIKAAEKAPVIGKPTTYLDSTIKATLAGAKSGVETLYKLFINKSHIPEFNDLISRHLLKRTHMEHQGIKYAIDIGTETKRIARTLIPKSPHPLNLVGTAKYVKTLTKKIGEVEGLIVSLVEQPRLAVRGTNKDVVVLAKSLRKFFRDMLTAELKAGVPITQLSKGTRHLQYFPRIASHELLDYLKEAGKRFTGSNAKRWDVLMSHAKKRTTGEWTLAEVNAFFKEHGYKGLGGKSIEQFFLKSPAPATAIRTTKSAKAVSSANFLDDVGRLFGKKVQEQPYWQKLPNNITKYNTKLKDLYFDPEVVAEATRVTEKYFDPAAAQGIVRLYDKYQNMWKRWTLAPFPKYHLRNIVGNLWNNHLADVNHPKWYLQAQALQSYRRSAGKFTIKPGMSRWGVQRAAFDEKLYNVSVKELKMLGITTDMADDFIKHAEELGVLSRGWYAADIAESIGKALRPPSYISNAMAVGTTFENNARLAHFLCKLNKGDDAYTAAQSVKKFLFDYTDLTSFERQVMKRFFPFYTWCVSEDTECLTKEGWKTYDEIKIGEEALSYNTNEKCFEWDIIKEIFSTPYNYKMFHFLGKSIDLLCTFDHRCVTSNGIRMAYEIAQNDTTSMEVKYEKEDCQISDKILKLICWIVTDGYSRMKGNCLEVVIYQKKEPYLTQIKELLDEKDKSESIHPDTGTTCVHIKGETRKTIQKYYQGKKTLWDLFIQLSPRQLSICIEEMMKAEGSCSYEDTTKEFRHFAQQGQEVLDAFQLATILGGIISNISSRGIYIRNKSTVKYPKPNVINYSGIIWCPVTSNGTWVSRRNGKVLITGNTRKNIPLQLEQLWKQPEKFRPLVTMLQNRSQEKLAQLKQVRPDLAGRLPLQLGLSGDTITYIPMEGLIPAGDLAKLFPKSQMGAPWGGLTDTVVEMLSPLIKTPFELLINKSFFRQADIEKYDRQTIDVLGMDLPATVAYSMITVFPLARLVNEVNKMTRKDTRGETLTGAEQALSQTLTSVYKLSLDDLRLRAVRSVQATMKELETGIMWARKYGRKKEEIRARQTLSQVRELLQKVR